MTEHSETAAPAGELALPIQFKFENQAIQTVLINGAPWFVANDVCAILGLKNTSRATNRLDDDEKALTFVNTPGGTQNVNIVNESGLYSLIFRSNKPAARRFLKTVTSEILPQIRKTGQYRPSPDGLTYNYRFAGPDRNDEALTRTLNVLIASHDIRQQTENLLKNIEKIEAIAAAADQNARTFTKSSLNDEDVSIRCPKCGQTLQDQRIVSDQMFDTARLLAIKAQELAIECRRERATVEALQAALAQGDQEESAFFDAVAVDHLENFDEASKAPANNSRSF